MRGRPPLMLKVLDATVKPLMLFGIVGTVGWVQSCSDVSRDLLVIDDLRGDTTVVSPARISIRAEVPVVVAFIGDSVEGEVLADFQYHLRPIIRDGIADSGFALVESYGPGVVVSTVTQEVAISTRLVQVGYLVVQQDRARLYAGVRTGINLLTDLTAPLCADARTTFDLRTCKTAELAEVDATLVSALSVGDWRAPGTADRYELWRRERTEACSESASDFEGGSLAGISGMSCAAELTLRRVERLR